MSFSDQAIDVLNRYSWPENIRELKNMIERLAILSKDKVIRNIDLPRELQPRDAGILNHKGALSFNINQNYEMAVNDYQKYIIHSALNHYKSKSKAAIALSINRSYLYELMDKFKIPS